METETPDRSKQPSNDLEEQMINKIFLRQQRFLNGAFNQRKTTIHRGHRIARESTH